MKLLFVTEYYPFYAAKVVNEVAKRLLDKECSVLVLSSNFEIGKKIRMATTEDCINGVPVIRFDSFPIQVASTPYLIGNPLEFVRLWKSLKHQINANDIIHFHTGHGFLNLSTAIFHKLNIGASATIYTSHGIPLGYDSSILEAGSTLARKIVKHVIIDNCKCITAVGLRDVSYWIENGVSAEKIRYIPNGVDSKTFRPCSNLRGLYREKLGFNHDEIVVLFLSQFRRAKGIEILLNAIPKAISHNPSIKFLLAGTGPMVSNAKLLIQRYNLTDDVKLLSYYIPDEELPGIFNACDFYVLPSLVEGMPLSLMEAMACGKPVITTSVGDIPVLVQDGCNGILIPQGRVDILTDTMVYLAKNFELRTFMGKENVKKMAEYDWDKIADQYHLLYSEILKA